MRSHWCHLSSAYNVKCFCSIGHDHFEDDMYEDYEEEL